MRLWLSPHLAYLKKTLVMLGLDVRVWRKGLPAWAPGDRTIQTARYPLPVKDRPVLTLEAERETDQVWEILQALDLQVDPNRLLGRCLRCNLPLSPLSATDLAAYRDRIPVYIRQTQRRFKRCPGCGRVYWPGTHARNMLKRLQELGLVE